ncbi:hypothetical protein EDD22DRAFT_952242 [Suillus occidentalis]|nr:hypothetical protein EDD22DRAFT_952242 [Suillus occidentalis]
MSDSCTLTADGTLKDVSKITFYNNPDNNTGHTLETVTAGSRCSGHPSKLSAHIHDTDNVASSSGTRKHAHASSSATEHPVSKKVPMRFISSLDSDNEDTADEDLPSAAPDPGKSSSDKLISQLDDDDDKAESQTASQTVSKSNHTADIQTIFTCIPEGWVCTLCQDAGEPAHKHTFRGGTSTL